MGEDLDSFLNNNIYLRMNWGKKKSRKEWKLSQSSYHHNILTSEFTGWNNTTYSCFNLTANHVCYMTLNLSFLFLKDDFSELRKTSNSITTTYRHCHQHIIVGGWALSLDAVDAVTHVCITDMYYSNFMLCIVIRYSTPSMVALRSWKSLALLLT